MQYWLVKSEPDEYSWQRFKQEKRTMWDGIRNYQARNFMRAMQKNDLVLFYHSKIGKEIVGLCSVVKTHYPDPTAESGDWSCVDLKAGKALPHPVSLSQLKADKIFKNCYLVRNARLSVMPITDKEYQRIMELSTA